MLLLDVIKKQMSYCDRGGREKKMPTTSRVYAVSLQDREPPAPPAPPAPGASREERAGYRESVSRHRQEVRRFCDSLAAELTGTDRPLLRSYLHTDQDGATQLRMSVFEFGGDAALPHWRKPGRNSFTRRTRNPAWRVRFSGFRPPSSTRQWGGG